MLACFYVLVVGAFSRTLSLKTLFAAFRKAALFASGIMALFGIIGIFTWFVAVERVAVNLSYFIATLNMSPVVFLLLVNIFLLIIGMVMDAIPVITIFMPVMMPIAMTLGIDPIHFGVVVVVNLMIGLTTPPAGGLLYVEMKISGVPFDRLVRASIPFIGAMLVVLFLITYVPSLITFLPNRFFGGF